MKIIRAFSTPNTPIRRDSSTLGKSALEKGIRLGDVEIVGPKKK
jgi:hypothetical protein